MGEARTLGVKDLVVWPPFIESLPERQQVLLLDFRTEAFKTIFNTGMPTQEQKRAVNAWQANWPVEVFNGLGANYCFLESKEVGIGEEALRAAGVSFDKGIYNKNDLLELLIYSWTAFPEEIKNKFRGGSMHNKLKSLDRRFM